METFTEAKTFVDHPGYDLDRRKTLNALDLQRIDAPIARLIGNFTRLAYAFSLQSCYGHFLWFGGQNENNLEPVPPGHEGQIDYRIAYLAVCIQNSPPGRALCQ